MVRKRGTSRAFINKVHLRIAHDERPLGVSLPPAGYLRPPLMLSHRAAVVFKYPGQHDVNRMQGLLHIAHRAVDN